MERQFTMKVDPALIEAVKAHVLRRGTTVSDLIRDLLMREIGWKEATDGVTPSLTDERRHAILTAYSRGEAGRGDTMVALGLDPSEVGAFARLMNGSGVAWPRPDRARAEEAAEILLELAPGLGERGDGR
ncbi:ribbon-helix-helix protein, CopG family [Methylobacterium sp. JK268]